MTENKYVYEYSYKVKSDAFNSVTNSLFAKEFPRSLAIATAKNITNIVRCYIWVDLHSKHLSKKLKITVGHQSINVD